MFWLIVVVIYLALSVFCIENSWKKMKRLRDVNEERDSQYPAFRRTDTHKWKKWKFYPIGMTALFRLSFSLSLVFISGIYSWFIRLGHDNDKPLTGIRKWLIQTYFAFTTRTVMMMYLIKLDYVWLDNYDYSYYLGPDYKQTQKLPKKVSTIIAAPH